MRMCFVFFKTNPKNQITKALIIETGKGRAETSQHERSLQKVKSPKTSISKFNLLLLKATLHRLTSSLHSSTPQFYHRDDTYRTAYSTSSKKPPAIIRAFVGQVIQEWGGTGKS